MPGNGLGQCQVCENGRVASTPEIDGKTIGVCATCETELRKSGRLENAEVPA